MKFIRLVRNMSALTASTPAIVNEEVTERVATDNTRVVDEADAAVDEANPDDEVVVDEANPNQQTVENFIQIDKLPWLSQLHQMEKEAKSKVLLDIPTLNISNDDNVLKMPGLGPELVGMLQKVNGQMLFNNNFSSITTFKKDLLEVEHYYNFNCYLTELISFMEANLYCDGNFIRNEHFQKLLEFIRFSIISGVGKRRNINDGIPFAASVALVLINLLGDEHFAAGYIVEDLIIHGKPFTKFDRNTKRLGSNTKIFISGLVFLTHVIQKTKVFDYTSEYFVDLHYSSPLVGFGKCGNYQRSKYASSFYEKVSLIIPGISVEAILDITKIDIDRMSINEINSSVADRIRSVLFNEENLFGMVVSYKYFIILFNNVASIKITQRLLKARLKQLIELDSGRVTNNFLLFLLRFNGPTRQATQDFKTLTDESVPFAQRQVMINSYIDQF